MQIPEAAWLAVVGAIGSLLTVIAQRLVPKSQTERDKERAEIMGMITAQWQAFIAPYRDERTDLLERIKYLQSEIDTLKAQHDQDNREWAETLRQRDSYIRNLLQEQQVFILKITEYEAAIRDSRRRPVTGILRYIEERDALAKDGKNPEDAQEPTVDEPRHE